MSDRKAPGSDRRTHKERKKDGSGSGRGSSKRSLRNKKAPGAGDSTRSVVATEFFKAKVPEQQAANAAPSPSSAEPSAGDSPASQAVSAFSTMGGASTEEKATIFATLQNEKFYHGMLPRDDIELMLQKDGDFMLRKTEVDGKTRVVLSVKWTGKCRHILLRRSRQGFWYLKDESSFEDIAELVTYYKKKKQPVTPDGTLLKHAVPRQSWELSHDSILIDKKLGEGQFGEVYGGEMQIDPKRRIPVAIKTLRHIDANKSERQQFVAEARLMRQLRHKNIVSLYGVCAQEQPMMIVMEICMGGSLLAHLRLTGTSVSLAEHCRYCVDAAKGMRFLEKNGVIHRDVAARNCLLGDKNDVKVSDFGLGQLAGSAQAEANQKMPIKWLAPETLATMLFTSKSDAWSFGILLWEIFSDGCEPYPEMNVLQTKEAVLKKNYTMEPPFGTPFLGRQLMKQLWKQNPQERPSFDTVTKELKAMYASTAAN